MQKLGESMNIQQEVVEIKSKINQLFSLIMQENGYDKEDANLASFEISDKYEKNLTELAAYLQKRK